MTTANHPTTTAFIGLGVMGEPMCRNLVRKGRHRVLVHDLRPEPVQRLQADGAEAVESVADAVRHGDVILLSLPGGPQLREVIAGPGGVLDTLAAEAGHADPARPPGSPPRLIVDHTTAPLALTVELAAACRAAGAQYCDAPIARTRQAATDGTLSIMVGGPPEVFARARPILELMASDITHCGGVGAGQVTKLLNNMILFQNVRAVAEAHAIATGLSRRGGPGHDSITESESESAQDLDQNSGLDLDQNSDLDLDLDLDLNLETVFGVIADASGGSFALKNHGFKSILADDYPTQAFSTEYALKDLSYALELAQQTGVDAVGARTVGRLMEQAGDAGHGDRYFPVLRKLL